MLTSPTAGSLCTRLSPPSRYTSPGTGLPGDFHAGFNGSVFRKCISASLLALTHLVCAKSTRPSAIGGKGLISPEVWGLFLVKYTLELEQGLALAFLSAQEPAPGSATAQQPLPGFPDPPPVPCAGSAGVSHSVMVQTLIYYFPRCPGQLHLCMPRSKRNPLRHIATRS